MCSMHGWYPPRHLLLLPHELGLKRIRRKHVDWGSTDSTDLILSKCYTIRTSRLHVPGRQAGARKAFFGFRAWSFQKLFISCVMKLQLSLSPCFCPSSVISGLRQEEHRLLWSGSPLQSLYQWSFAAWHNGYRNYWQPNKPLTRVMV